jgi:hypothetical protein
MQGLCTRGDSCRFSHDPAAYAAEELAATTIADPIAFPAELPGAFGVGF